MLTAKLEWIHVKDRLPDYGRLVLVARTAKAGRIAPMPVVLSRRTHTDVNGEHWENTEGLRSDMLTRSGLKGEVVYWLEIPENPLNENSEK